MTPKRASLRDDHVCELVLAHDNADICAELIKELAAEDRKAIRVAWSADDANTGPAAMEIDESNSNSSNSSSSSRSVMDKADEKEHKAS